MRKNHLVAVLLVVALALAAVSAFAEEFPVERLSYLTKDELSTLVADINSEIKLHYDMPSGMESSIRKTVETAVESYLTEKGMSAISWPWFDHNYTRVMNNYLFTSHVDYKDTEGKKHSDNIKASLCFLDGNLTISCGSPHGTIKARRTTRWNAESSQRN